MSGSPAVRPKSDCRKSKSQPNRRLDMLVDEAELARHRAEWKAPKPRFERGYGYMFNQHVTQADQGCDFDFLQSDFGRTAGEPDIY